MIVGRLRNEPREVDVENRNTDSASLNNLSLKKGYYPSS